MNDSDIVYALVFNKLHCKIDSIENIQIAQYKFYLVQQAGFPLNFGFTWHINGPYSEDLTDNMFYVSTDSIKHEAYIFKSYFQKKIDNVNSLYINNKENLTEYYLYHLFAIITYYAKNGLEINNRIIKDKNIISEYLCDKGYNKKLIKQVFKSVFRYIIY